MLVVHVTTTKIKYCNHNPAPWTSLCSTYGAFHDRLALALNVISLGDDALVVTQHGTRLHKSNPDN
jgi:hypothetical protein